MAAGCPQSKNCFEVAAFGLSLRRDPNTTETVIVLVHSDETSARQNVDLLLKRLEQTRLSDGSPLYAGRLQGVELQVDGSMLIARIASGPWSSLEYLTPGGLVDVPLTVHE